MAYPAAAIVVVSVFIVVVVVDVDLERGCTGCGHGVVNI
jgi:hypothetical protein